MGHVRQVFRTESQEIHSRASAEIQTGPSHGGASGCIEPTTNLAASTRNLRNIQDRYSDQPAKGRG